MNSFRTPQKQEEYREIREHFKNSHICALCEKTSVEEYEYWRIVKNDYPYDRIAKVHDMLIPKRHITEEFFNDEENLELKEIKKKLLDSDYEFIIETTKQKKSIPEHFHLHLVTTKDEI